MPKPIQAWSNEQLWDLWSWTRYRPVRSARAMFPDRPKGYVRAAHDLGNWASNFATMVRCRQEGKIKEAVMYCDILQRIWNKLPEYAKAPACYPLTRSQQY